MVVFRIVFSPESCLGSFPTPMMGCFAADIDTSLKSHSKAWHVANVIIIVWMRLLLSVCVLLTV